MIQECTYINGEFLRNDRSQEIHSPYTGKLIGRVAEADAQDIERAISSAKKAYKDWQSSTRVTRQALLRDIAQMIRKNTKELCEVMAMEIGKPLQVGEIEVKRACKTFEMCADLLTTYGGEWLPADADPRGHGYNLMSERFPLGPLFGIVPYNWPINLAAHKIGPAIATGNTIIIKCSPFSPLSTLALGRLIHEAGCPAGVVNVLNTSPELAEKLARDERISLVSFTGSPKVGWHLKRILPEKKVILELGSNSSSIIHQDADLNSAIQKNVLGAFAYAGQSCVSVQHIYAHESLYELCKEKLIAATKTLPCGDPSNPNTVCGPLISQDATTRVLNWIQEAMEQGATLLTGGKVDNNVIQPTLLEGRPSNATLSNEEVFGPVATLESYKDINEVIEKINSSQYGIHTGLFTKDLSLISHAYKTLNIGGLIVNDSPNMRLDMMPYGGVRKSGFGREGIRYTFDEFTEIKALLINLI